MIVRITFDNDKVMLFGNSYKDWYTQFEEYYYYQKNTPQLPIKFESCKDKWVGWGGLKWSSEDSFQEQLNMEGCQDWEEKNKNPRQYTDMVFVEDSKIKNKIMKIIKER